MKTRYRGAICIALVAVLCLSAGWCGNLLLTRLIQLTNAECRGQKFATAEEAIQAMEDEKLHQVDTSLDYCPPYELVYSFDYDGNTIVLYSFYDSLGYKDERYAVRILKHNNDGTLSFDSGFADFYMSQPEEDEEYYYYYFTDIQTSRGRKNISFVYLDKDTDKELYIDGVKAEKILASIEGQEFYLCYAISPQDTFWKNLTTPVENRHKIKFK